MNRDVVAVTVPVVMSPTPPTVVGMGFIEIAEEDLGCGTTSSTDETDIVGL